MIGDLKAYTEYKESGLPWLGRMPAHWGMKRGKSLFHRIDQRSATGKEELLTVSSARGVVPRRTANVTMFKAESYLGYKLCWPGDLVINSLWAWAGGLGVTKYHGIISSAYGVYRVRSGAPLHPDFVHELVRSSRFHWELQVRSKGVWISRLQLTSESFLDAPIPLPPPDEQAAIVRFLEHANGRLERAIRAKRKVISLLNEQKQAIIHRAITRGLDPAVHLQPSGIPWLGDIPTHWEIQRLKRVCRVQGGYAFPSSAFGDRGIPVVRMTNLRRGKLDLSSAVRIPDTECVEAFGLRAGDILYGLSGSIGATGSLGNFAIVTERDLPAMLNQRVARFVPKRHRICPEYLVLLLQTSVFYEQVLADTTGTAQFNVSTNDVENVAIGLPPLEEQIRLVTKIETTVAPLITAIARLEREISLLREYRTRLTADVVTGKLDVRATAAALPADVELSREALSENNGTLVDDETLEETPA